MTDKQTRQGVPIMPELGVNRISIVLIEQTVTTSPLRSRHHPRVTVSTPDGQLLEVHEWPDGFLNKATAISWIVDTTSRVAKDWALTGTAVYIRHTIHIKLG